MIFVGSHDLSSNDLWFGKVLAWGMTVFEEQTQIILLYITHSQMPIMLLVLRSTVVNILSPRNLCNAFLCVISTSCHVMLKLMVFFFKFQTFDNF